MDVENTPIIIINDPEENVIMECDDDELEPLENQVVEYLDFDNPIQYTDEQVILQLLNVLSYKDNNVYKNKSFWNRRSREFLNILKAIQNKDGFHVNDKLQPIIAAKKIRIEESDLEMTEGEIEAMEEEIKVIFVKNNDVLISRSFAMNIEDDYKRVLLSIIESEKIWNDDADNDYPKIVLKKDVEGYINYILPFNSQDRNIRFLGGHGDYEGDNLSLMGYYYRVHDVDLDLLQFDFQDYVNALDNLTIDERVEVYHNYKSRPLHGQVKEMTKDDVLVLIDGQSTPCIIHKAFSKLHENEYFVYRLLDTESSKFHKYKLKTRNVLIKFPTVKFDMDDLLSVVLPTPYDLMNILKKELSEVYSLYDLKTIFERFGLHKGIFDVDEKMFSKLKHLLYNNVTKITKPKAHSIVSYRPVFKSRYSILNFFQDSYKFPNALDKYSNYVFKNRFNDTEYNRMKYIFSHGDCGLIFFQYIITDYCDSVFTSIEHEITKNGIVEEMHRIEKIVKESKELLNKSCKDIKEPPIKRTYTSVEQLEKDNFRELEGVEEGDFAKLQVEFSVKANKDSYKEGHTSKTNVKDSGYILYKRVFVQDKEGNKHMWIRDRFVPYHSCSTGNQLPDSKHVKSQECVYDTKEDICVNKEYHKHTNRIEILKKRQDILQNILRFYENSASIKQKLQESREKIYISNLNSFKYLPGSISYDSGKRYDDFIGDPDNEDEERKQQAEQGENVFYTVLRKNEGDNQDVNAGDSLYVEPEQEETRFAQTLLSYLGIELAEKFIKIIVQRYKSLHHLIYDENPLTRPKDKLNQKNTGRRYISKQEWVEVQIKIDMKKPEHKGKPRNYFVGPVTTFVESRIQKNSTYLMSALILILVQLQLPDIKLGSGQSLCKFGLQGYPLNEENHSLLKYMACVIKKMSNPNHELLKVFDKETDGKIEIGIKECVNMVIKLTPIYNEGLETARNRLQKPKRANALTMYPEWGSFRPVMKIFPEGNETVVKYIKRIYDLSEKTATKLLLKDTFTIMSDYNTDDTFKRLQSHLQKQEKHTQIQKSVYGYFESVKLESENNLFATKTLKHPDFKSVSIVGYKNRDVMKFDDVVQEAIANLGSENETYWDDFTLGIQEHLMNFQGRFNIDKGTMTSLSNVMFGKNEGQLLNLRNIMRCVLKDDIKGFLGKSTNGWKKIDNKRLLDMPLKKHEFDIVKEIMNTRTDNLNALLLHRNDEIFVIELRKKVKDIAEKLKYVSKPFTSIDKDMFVKRSVYLYDYIFVHILYDLVSLINNNADDIYDLTKISDYTNTAVKGTHKIIIKFCESIIKRFVSKVNENIFDADFILRNNEKLREEAKDKTLKAFGKFNKEDVPAYKIARQLGLVQLSVEDEDFQEVDAQNLEETRKTDKRTDEDEAGDITYGGEDADEDNTDNLDGDDGMWGNDD